MRRYLQTFIKLLQVSPPGYAGRTSAQPPSAQLRRKALFNKHNVPNTVGDHSILHET